MGTTAVGTGRRRRWMCCLVLAVIFMGAGAGSATDSAPSGRVTVAADTRWATPWYLHDSGLPGPTVVVVAGLHGDEPAGCWAAEEIRHWPLLRGKLILLPKANVPALDAAAACWPSDGRDNDLDRRFTQPENLSAEADSLAAAIWRQVAAARPDWFVDLCENTRDDAAAPPGLGSMAAVGNAATAAAARILAAVNGLNRDAAPEFAPGAAPAVGSLAQAVADRLHAQTLVFQTAAHDLPLAPRIRRQRLMLHALLADLGMIHRQTDVDRIVSDTPAPGRMRLAVYAGPGTRLGMHHLLQEMQRLPQAEVVPIGAEEIDAGMLRHFNVVLFPGGSSTRQGESLGNVDRNRVRQFIEQGGGYVGICAGAFLATTDWPNSLSILDAKTYSHQWKRGRGVVRMELTPQGRQILGVDRLWCDVRYHNGPILVPAQRKDLPDYQPLAIFRSEVAEYGPKGIMVGTPAIVAGQFGRGRVLCFSPHPEATKGLEEMVRHGVLWAGRNG